MKGIRVILADDHAMVRAGMRGILEDAGIAVVGEAGTADEALALVAGMPSEPPDLVVMDVSMPGTSALEAIRRLRVEHPDVRSLVVSVYGEDQYGLRSLRAGASGYLTKERSGRDLVDAVQAIHEGRRYVSPDIERRFLDETPAPEGRPPHETLSPREYDVMCQIGRGSSITEISKRLVLSPKTVSTFRARLLKKMGFKGDADIVRYVAEYAL